MEFGQLIEYNKNITSQAENEAGRLVPDLYLFFRKAVYVVKASDLLPGPQLKQISYQLNSMDAQKNVNKKQIVKLLGLTMFVKKKFNETHKYFSTN